MATYFDFDGTLAYFDSWHGQDHTGEPIRPMLQKVQECIKNNEKAVIFTARMSQDKYVHDVPRVKQAIEQWCLKHVGAVLPVTNIKSSEADRFYDDRAVGVVKNTGLTVGEFVATVAKQELRKPSTKEEAINRILETISKIGT